MTRCLWPVLLCGLLAGPAYAKDKPEVQADRGRQLRGSVRQVERDTGGEVLRAERVPQDGRSVNRIKVITPEGRVRVYREDVRGSGTRDKDQRSEEHTSELQSLMRISYAVFCLEKKKKQTRQNYATQGITR